MGHQLSLSSTLPVCGPPPGHGQGAGHRLPGDLNSPDPQGRILAQRWRYRVRKPARPALIQRFGSALNLNVHFHILFLDGVYVYRDNTSASRIPPALADDGLLPAWFGKASRWGTPANSIVFYGIGALIFALNSSFLVRAVISTLARLLAYIASIVSLPRLRRKAGLPATNLTIRIAAPIALLLSVGATLQTNRDQWLTLGALALAGAALYFIARRHKTDKLPS